MDGRPRAIDPVEHAHLRDATGFSPPVHRYAPGPGLADLVRRYWVPVWSLPPGTVSRQRVLQYPVCLVVVADSYARLYGPRTGLSVTELAGDGWAVGAMLQPAAGAPVWGRPVRELTDRFVDLAQAPGVDGPGLTTRIRDVMGADAASRLAAVAVLERELERLPPVEDEGRLVNAIVEYVEGDPQVRRVGQVCAKFDIRERTLQRLLARRLGLHPKWLIQRRRLQEAAARLRADAVDLAGVAAELGYADQAHLTRDFRTVTGLTPGEYAAEPDTRTAPPPDRIG
ncbi:helix-turn-helix domain-containing protein [Pseudonocardia hydrocarbonoxydans]|uniref:helix-turn-helix domain-containing protein n=1 Tax=Pseudonocardia hydrocarbonoxydans TaxID=76726 RepID=UPI001C3FD493|nr:helix-turn-helix domain-containing protein [Pseudonocardia hydrocarbonoxydans]